MSWDVVMVRTKTNGEALKGITGENIVPFTQTEIAEAVKNAAAALGASYDCADLSYQHLGCGGWSIEFNVGGEASKSGVAPENALELARLAVQMPHVRLRGLMAIPPAAHVAGENRHFFAEMYHLYVDIRTALDHNVTDMDCLSMGMSGDYEDAVREGATHVRVGTALFGPRPPMTKQSQG